MRHPSSPSDASDRTSDSELVKALLGRGVNSLKAALAEKEIHVIYNTLADFPNIFRALIQEFKTLGKPPHEAFSRIMKELTPFEQSQFYANENVVDCLEILWDLSGALVSMSEMDDGNENSSSSQNAPSEEDTRKAESVPFQIEYYDFLRGLSFKEAQTRFSCLNGVVSAHFSAIFASQEWKRNPGLVRAALQALFFLKKRPASPDDFKAIIKKILPYLHSDGLDGAERRGIVISPEMRRISRFLLPIAINLMQQLKRVQQSDFNKLWDTPPTKPQDSQGAGSTRNESRSGPTSGESRSRTTHSGSDRTSPAGEPSSHNPSPSASRNKVHNMVWALLAGGAVAAAGLGLSQCDTDDTSERNPERSHQSGFSE